METSLKLNKNIMERKISITIEYVDSDTAEDIADLLGRIINEIENTDLLGDGRNIAYCYVEIEKEE